MPVFNPLLKGADLSVGESIVGVAHGALGGGVGAWCQE